MTLRIDGAGFNLPVASVRDPLVAAGFRVLLDPSAGVAPAGYTRSGAIYLPQADGSLALCASDALPREWDGSRWCYRIDPGFTNRMLWSDDLSNAVWVTSDAAVNGATWTAPDGMVYPKLSASATNQPHFIRQSVAFTAGEVVTVRFLLRAAEESSLSVAVGGAGSTTVFGVSSAPLATFNASTGVATLGAYATSATMRRIHGDAWMCAVTTVTTSGAASAQMRFLLRDGAAYLGDGVAGIHIDRINCTNTAYPAPMTLSTSAAVPIGSHTWPPALSGLVSLGSEYTLYSESSSMAALSTSSHIVRLDDGTEANRAIMYRPGGSSTVGGIVTNSNAASYSATNTAGINTLNKLMLRLKLNDMRIAHNGALLTADDGSSAMPTGINRLVIGHAGSAGVSPLAGRVYRVAAHPTSGVSDALLQSLTA